MLFDLIIKVFKKLKKNNNINISPIVPVSDKISKKILTDIDGCSEEDIAEALTQEAVFLPKCMKRRKLQAYFKEFEHDGDTVYMCTIGDTELAGSSIKGGRKRIIARRKMTRRKMKTTRHSKSKSKRNRKTHRR